MTSANGLIGQAKRRAADPPLAWIVAAMLGGSTGFFCYAMPAPLLDSLLGPLGAPLPVNIGGRALFMLIFAALAALLGWLAMTAVSRATRPRFERENEIDLQAFAERRRPIGPAHPSEAINAPPPSLLAVRRGDGHPDAPPRRPIFAHELGSAEDTTEAGGWTGAGGAGDVTVPPAGTAAPEHAAEYEADEPEQPADEIAMPEPEQVPAEEPLELIDAIEAAPAAGPADDVEEEEEPTLASLMARFEHGLDRRDVEPRAIGQDSVTLLKPDRRNSDEALRDALDALKRMAARQR